MPKYPWLLSNTLDGADLPRKIKVMRQLGVPYEEGYEDQAWDDLMAQAQEIASTLEAEMAQDGIEVVPETEIVALIAYLQRLGTDIKGQSVTSNQPTK